MADLFYASKCGKTGLVANVGTASSAAFRVMGDIRGPVLLELQCSIPMHFTQGDANVREASVDELLIPAWQPWPLRIDDEEDNCLRVMLEAGAVAPGTIYITNVSDLERQPLSIDVEGS